MFVIPLALCNGGGSVPSSIAWLDVSAEEQRKAREFIALFTQPESRDELGIGQVRDAFSNTLFPGTSVIQTRARYFLYVPWIYLAGQRQGKSGQELTRWTESRERRLIEVLRTAGTAVGDINGLIGKEAGERLKILPSSIYWNGLIKFGILRRDVAAGQLGAERARQQGGESDELAERESSTWSPSIPEPPDGFPKQVDTAFALRPDEARWLAERINQSPATRGSLLAQIVSGHARIVGDSFGPWDDPVGQVNDKTLRLQLEHAELFSLGMHGASLLYNLLVAERYVDCGYDRVPDATTRYRELIDKWATECVDARQRLAAWDRTAMWNLVRSINPRIGRPTIEFVENWLENVTSGQATNAVDDQALRDLVHKRELRRGKQSRLQNDKLLANWAGESGAGRLNYRWGTVRRIVQDIHSSLDSESTHA
jgi:hypothetical protein